MARYERESDVQQQDGVFLHARCHLGAGLNAFLAKGGDLTLFCGQCGKYVMTFEASEPPDDYGIRLDAHRMNKCGGPAECEFCQSELAQAENMER